MKQKTPEVIYYTDELQDEFSVEGIKAKYIGEDYPYLHKTVFGSFFHAFLYRVIAFPLAFFYLKLKFHHRIKGKEKLKANKKKPFFIYGNHTQMIADALIPSFVCHPKTTYAIVHPNNVSMPFLGHFTPYLGAIPLPDDLKAMRNFIQCIDKRVSQKKAICIYPEAHIWPYYTKIRPFVDTSFHYPVKYDTDVYCFTNTYQRRKRKKGVDIITYIDGPFYPDKNLSMVENKKRLRDLCYQVMTKRAQNSDVEVIHYERKENE